MKTIGREKNLFENVSLANPIESLLDSRLRAIHTDQKVFRRSADFIATKMSTFLTSSFEEFKNLRNILSTTNLSFHVRHGNDHAFDNIKEQYAKEFLELARRRSETHHKTPYLFPIEPSDRFLVPPYDVHWTDISNHGSKADKASGSFSATPVGNATAAGIGIYLTPVFDVSAQFNTHCPVSYSWSNFVNQDGGYAATQGGLGMVIYNTTKGTIVKDESAILWTQSRWPSGLDIGGSNNDVFYQTTSLRNTSFDMEAGNTYLVWMWCWAFSDCSTNALAFATIDCNAPFMILETSYR